MIVNYTAQGWEIFTQRAHGSLSGQLASHWRHEVRTERWFETLMAIAEHDDARLEPDGMNLLTPQGGPLNFKMTAYDHEHCIQTLRSALSKSRYVALLCSMHLEFVFGQLAKGSVEGSLLMNDQVTLREKWRNELGISEQQAKSDYRLLEWCDALSLLLCQRAYQPQQRSIEISKGPDGFAHYLRQDRTGVLEVTPWPFEEEEFEVYIESRIIGQLIFRDDADFRKAFSSASVVNNSWIFRRKKDA